MHHIDDTDILNYRTDRQPFRSCAIRRCSRLRNWLCHHFLWRPLSILWCEDWTLTLGQTYRQRGELRKRGVVGTSEQAYDNRCKWYTISSRNHPLHPIMRECADALRGAMRYVMHRSHCRASSLAAPAPPQPRHSDVCGGDDHVQRQMHH